MRTTEGVEDGLSGSFKPLARGGLESPNAWTALVLVRLGPHCPLDALEILRRPLYNLRWSLDASV